MVRTTGKTSLLPLLIIAVLLYYVSSGGGDTRPEDDELPPIPSELSELAKSLDNDELTAEMCTDYAAYHGTLVKLIEGGDTPISRLNTLTAEATQVLKKPIPTATAAALEAYERKKFPTDDVQSKDTLLSFNKEMQAAFLELRQLKR